MHPDSNESSLRPTHHRDDSQAASEPNVSLDERTGQNQAVMRWENLAGAPLVSVFRLSPVAQALVDVDLRLTVVNEEFARLVGVDAERLIDRQLSTVLPAFHEALLGIDLTAGQSVTTSVDSQTRCEGAGAQPVVLVVRPIGDDGTSASYYSLTLLPQRVPTGVSAQSVTDLRRERAARREAEVSAEIVERILGITDVALAHIDLNDLLNELLSRIRDVLMTDEASILVIDPGDDSLSLRVSLGPDRLVRRPVRVRIGVGFAGRIAATKRPIVLEDTKDFPFTNSAIRDRGVRSLMGVPMLIGDRVLGVVHVGMMSHRQFDGAELHLLELAAARIALAIDRANLYQAERDARDVAEQAQHRNQFLANASEVLSASLDYQETLGRLARIVVPEVADICTVTVIGQDDIVRLIASCGSTPELEAVIARQRQYFPRPLNECPPVQSIVDTTSSLLIDPLDPRFIEQDSGDSGHLELLRQANLVSGMRVPMKSGGRVIGMISLWLANTERRFQAEDITLVEDLAHRAALATDNAWHYEAARKAIGARDEFISIASHELKTPLTTVKGYVQLLRRHVDDVRADRDRVNRTLSQLQDQVMRFEELVDDLLDVSRVHGGRIRLSYEYCDLSHLVNQVVERVGQAVEQEPPHRFELETAGPIWGYWDASRLDQVVTNLISNAMKYSPAGSEVRVEVEANDTDAEILVRDHGIGISPEDINLVVQPFTRGSGASEIAPGAGLGLYIANEIVRRHRGTLTIQSEQGEGSTFIVRLPRDLRQSG